MSFLNDIKPGRVIRDTRSFLSQEQPYKWRFLLLSAGATLTIFLAFVSESGFEKEYKRPEIIWVESFSPDRSTEDIKREQLLDMIDKEIAEQKRAEAEEARRERWKAVGRMVGMDVDEE